MAYTWIPFYKELAQKLFRFSRNRTRSLRDRRLSHTQELQSRCEIIAKKFGS